MLMELIMQWELNLGAERAQPLSAPFGTFQYIHMPFGLANAGSVYSRMLDLAWSRWTETFGRQTWMTYWPTAGNLGLTLDIWHRLFWHLRQLESRYNPVKPICSSQRCRVPGHKISKGGVSMIPEYIQKIKQDRKRSTYLPGFARYYQAFILQYLVLTVEQD